MVDDSVHHIEVGKEGDDLHRAPTLGAEHRVDFINLPDHFGPALGRDAPELVLNNPERRSRKARLLDLPPMGVGVQPIIAHRHLALVGDMSAVQDVSADRLFHRPKIFIQPAQHFFDKFSPGDKMRRRINDLPFIFGRGS